MMLGQRLRSNIPRNVAALRQTNTMSDVVTVFTTHLTWLQKQKNAAGSAHRTTRREWSAVLLARVGLNHVVDLFLHRLEVKRSRVLHRRKLDRRFR